MTRLGAAVERGLDWPCPDRRPPLPTVHRWRRSTRGDPAGHRTASPDPARPVARLAVVEWRPPACSWRRPRLELKPGARLCQSGWLSGGPAALADSERRRGL